MITQKFSGGPEDKPKNLIQIIPARKQKPSKEVPLHEYALEYSYLAPLRGKSSRQKKVSIKKYDKCGIRSKCKHTPVVGAKPRSKLEITPSPK